MAKAIRTERLTKVYTRGIGRSSTVAVRDLNLEIGVGETFGFIGPNGAGKSTTIKLLVGLLRPTSGRAWLFDQPAASVRVKERLGFLPELPYFYDYLSAEQFLYYCGQLFGLTTQEQRRRTETLLSMVGLERARREPLRKFSKGMLQRIGLAQALMNDPDLVILDEPLSGLDPIGRYQVREIILGLKQRGKTVFFSSHILSDVMMVCDRVGMLVEGRLAALGRIDELVGDSVHSIEIVSAISRPEVAARIAACADRLVEQEGKMFINVASEKVQDEVLDILRAEGCHIESITPNRKTLEELLIQEAGPEAFQEALD